MDSDDYLLACVRYIDLNQVSAMLRSYFKWLNGALVKAGIYLMLALSLSACLPTFIGGKEHFKQDMEREVGRILDLKMSPTFSGVPHTAIKGGYVFDFGSGCEIFLSVEDRISKITGWRYLVDPNLCVAEINWGGHW